MRDLFYHELQKRAEEIRKAKADSQSESSSGFTESEKMLIDTIELLLDLSETSRNEGLLSLEERAVKMEGFPGSKYLKKMILLVVDGTDPEQVQEVTMARYFTSELSDYAALQYLIMMYGILGIQSGMSPRIMEESLENMLPEEIADRYEKIKEEEILSEKSETKEDDPDMSMVENLCKDELESDNRPGDQYYYVVKMLEDLIIQLDDRAIRRVLAEVQSSDIAIAMKILGGKARKCIFSNISKRLAVMIAEDMSLMGPVRACDAGEACRNILLTLLKLVKSGEIMCEEELIIHEMATVFLGRVDTEKKQTIRESENKLYQLWQDYLSYSNRRVQ